MYYVYIIQSLNFPDQIYTGYTSNLKERLNTHNYGLSAHTQKYAPWKLVMFLAFDDKHKAMNFEKYLKSSSGRAFKNKRFLSNT